MGGCVRTTMRFKRSPSQLLGSRLYTRRELNSRLDTPALMDRGAFLGRLWGLFGKPSARIGGFEYFLTDTKTGLSFVAYIGPHGPCYGGELSQRAPLRSVLEAFEAMIAQSRAVPCAFEYTAEGEYGGGQWVVGYRDGRSFDLPDRRNRKAPSRVERRTATAVDISSSPAPGSAWLRSSHRPDRSRA